VKTADIPTGTKGRPLGQGHVDAHEALVEHVAALEEAVAMLTARLDVLEEASRDDR
jgi:hypothetical protein